MKSILVNELKKNRFFEINPFISFAWIFITWLGIVLLIVLSKKYTLFYVPIIFLMGNLQYRLNILGHDGLHYLLCKSHVWNDWISRYFIQGPILSPLNLLRYNHLLHHQKLGENEDQDSHYYNLDDMDAASFKKKIVLSLLGNTTIEIARKLISKATSNQKININIDIFSIIMCQIVIFWVFYYFSGNYFYYFIFWILPNLTIFPGLNAIRSCLEHASLNNEPHTV